MAKVRSGFPGVLSFRPTVCVKTANLVITDLPENAAENGADSKPLEWLSAFVPRRGLRNGHLQTLVGNYFPRPACLLRVEAETVEVDPADGSRVLCHNS